MRVCSGRFRELSKVWDTLLVLRGCGRSVPRQVSALAMLLVHLLVGLLAKNISSFPWSAIGPLRGRLPLSIRVTRFSIFVKR